MARIVFKSTTASKLSELPIVDGQLIFVKDTHSILLDNDSKRIKYEQITILQEDTERTSILAPITNIFYFVEETNCLWKYKDGWVLIYSPVSAKIKTTESVEVAIDESGKLWAPEYPTLESLGVNIEEGDVTYTVEVKKNEEGKLVVPTYPEVGSGLGGITVSYDAEQKAIVFTDSSGTISIPSSEIMDNPAYFYDETANTISKLSTIRKPGTLFIIFITDSHIYTSSNNKQYFDAQMASIKAVSAAIKPDLVVHGGDMTNGSESKDVTIAFTDSVVNQLKEVGGNDTLILIGNHDGNCISTSSNGSDRITEQEMLSMYRSWDDGFVYPEGKLYGYRDYDDIGLRVIRLHSYMGDSTYGGLGTNWGYPDDEKSWFEGTALNTNYDIVILSHQTLSPVLQGYQESQNIPYNGTLLQQAIDNWQNDNRHCVGVIHGHVHWDYVHTGKGDFTVIDHESKSEISRTGSYGEFYEYGQGYANYLTTFSTTNTQPPVSSYRDTPKDAIVYGRTVNTETQALWTAIVIDPSTKHIDFVRFGAGNDVSMNYIANTSIAVSGVTLNLSNGELYEGDTVDLVATVQPSNASNKSVTWESSKPEIATVNSGHVVAIKAGDCTITAKTVDGNKTATYSLVVKEKEKVNALLSATDSSGIPYNEGTGYKEGYRLNSSGNESAQSGAYITGFIPCSAGNTLEINGFNSAADDSVSGANYCYIAVYDSSKTLIKSNYSRDWFNMGANKAQKDENNYLSKITLNIGVGNASLSNMAYVRISGVSVSDNPSIYIS